MLAKAKPEISIVVAVNDEAVLSRNLLQSPAIVAGQATLHTFYNQPSASRAYNLGIRQTTSALVAFVHQDVYLPQSWIENLRLACQQLSASDPDWAVIGAFGVQPNGLHAGTVWSSGLGRSLGSKLEVPVPVASVDELAIIIRRDSKCIFDDELPSFHLYGTDIVQIARSKGRTSYVAHLPVIHNSRPIRGLGGGFAIAHKYMRRKWSRNLPVPTLTVPLTVSPFPLWRARLRLFLSRRARAARATPSTTSPQIIAKKLHYE